MYYNNDNVFGLTCHLAIVFDPDDKGVLVYLCDLLQNSLWDYSETC